MKIKCNVCKVYCEHKSCVFEHIGEENICPFDARYLDLAEHDKQIISDVIDYVFSELNRLHISYDSEENSVRTTYYDGTDDETTVDIVKGILKENFVKEIKEQNK